MPDTMAAIHHHAARCTAACNKAPCEVSIDIRINLVTGILNVERKLRPAMATQVARMRPRNVEGTEQQRAQNDTHIAVWKTFALKVMQDIIYFEHCEKV